MEKNTGTSVKSVILVRVKNMVTFCLEAVTILSGFLLHALHGRGASSGGFGGRAQGVELFYGPCLLLFCHVLGKLVRGQILSPSSESSIKGQQNGSPISGTWHFPSLTPLTCLMEAVSSEPTPAS